ncbi:hypothetical protein PHAVU_002G116100, partial [Phaseolus vulgaris]
RRREPSPSPLTSEHTTSAIMLTSRLTVPVPYCNDGDANQKAMSIQFRRRGSGNLRGFRGNDNGGAE